MKNFSLKRKTHLHSWRIYYRGRTACWIPRENSRTNAHFVQIKKKWSEDILGLPVQHWILNAIAYSGKEGNRIHYNFTQDIVIKVDEPWYGTDNFFTSYTLSNRLLQQNLTLLGTVRRHRGKVPLVLRQEEQLYRSKFVFNHGDEICLVANQAKQNKNPVILLSSSHSDPSVDSGESKQPQMILDYNASKGSAHTFDQNLEELSWHRKIVRWPLLFFLNIPDAAANNAYIIMQKNGYTCSRKDFLKTLTLDLASPSIQSRLCKSKVRNSVQEAAAQISISTPAVTKGLQHFLKPKLPKRCAVCKKNSRRQCDLCIDSHFCSILLLISICSVVRIFFRFDHHL